MKVSLENGSFIGIGTRGTIITMRYMRKEVFGEKVTQGAYQEIFEFSFKFFLNPKKPILKNIKKSGSRRQTISM